MNKLTVALVAALVLAAGCQKKEAADNADNKSGAAAPAAKSGLAWEPDGYDKLDPTCKKDLACCEAITKDEKGSPTPEDYNGACSGPALWKEADCKTDLASRLVVLDSAKKPVPAACK